MGGGKRGKGEGGEGREDGDRRTNPKPAATGLSQYAPGNIQDYNASWLYGTMPGGLLWCDVKRCQVRALTPQGGLDSSLVIAFLAPIKFDPSCLAFQGNSRSLKSIQIDRPPNDFPLACLMGLSPTVSEINSE